jgi:cell pole-organizing protein PopZ
VREGVDEVGSEMTQPAKVQEPSMEEILASIRRIIADDEAKPPAPEKPAAAPESAKPNRAATAAKPAAVTDLPAAKAPPPKAAPPPPAPPPPPPPAPAAVPSNNQDDIDALLAGLDEATSPDQIRPAQPDAEVLELTDDMAVTAPPMPSFQKVEPHDDIEFAEAAASRATHRPVYDPPGFDTPMPPQQPILSQSTVSAVESAFNTLAHTVLSNNARTLEDLVKEMLRPMLKSWLDDNLPGLVERIVKAEIERVSRGR